MTKGRDSMGPAPETHYEPMMHQDDGCCRELGFRSFPDFSRKLEIQPARLLMSLPCV